MNKKTEKQIENDEIYKRYVKCYWEWCAEIDELTNHLGLNMMTEKKRVMNAGTII